MHGTWLGGLIHSLVEDFLTLGTWNLKTRDSRGLFGRGKVELGTSRKNISHGMGIEGK